MNWAGARRLPDRRLLCESGSTAWIASGWTGTVPPGGLLLRRGSRQARVAQQAAGPADPLRLEIFGALFMTSPNRWARPLKKRRHP